MQHYFPLGKIGFFNIIGETFTNLKQNCWIDELLLQQIANDNISIQL